MLFKSNFWPPLITALVLTHNCLIKSGSLFFPKNQSKTNRLMFLGSHTLLWFKVALYNSILATNYGCSCWSHTPQPDSDWYFSLQTLPISYRLLFLDSQTSVPFKLVLSKSKFCLILKTSPEALKHLSLIQTGPLFPKIGAKLTGWFIWVESPQFISNIF